MTSTDVDETVRFLLTAMPEFSIRGEGGGEGSPAQRWVHVGTENSYLCIESRGATEKGPHKPYFHPGMNHMGFVVSDGGNWRSECWKPDTGRVRPISNTHTGIVTISSITMGTSTSSFSTSVKTR